MPWPLTKIEAAYIQSVIERHPEVIIAAAIKAGDVVVTVERPGRHGNLISAAGRITGDCMQGGEHGFLTSYGRFVDRTEAAQIAVARGQGAPRDVCNSRLFSEDLWLDAQPSAEGGEHG